MSEIGDETLKSIVWMGSLGTVRRADEGMSGCGFQIGFFFGSCGGLEKEGGGGGGGVSRTAEGRQL